MVGVEVGGAVKNVLAIGAGISDGLGFGANTRVALITRGLAEMMRLGVALGAERETFMGLAGLGDLVLTCTDDQSRNRRCGLALAAGKTPAQAQAEIGQVVEGVLAARAVHEVAQAPRRRDADRRAGLPRALRGRPGQAGRVGADGPHGEVRDGLDPRQSAGRARLDTRRRAEAELPPGFVDRHRHRVREIEAARARSHRDAQPTLGRAPLQHLVRQAARLRAEDQGVAVRVPRLVVPDLAAGREREPARRPEAREAVLEACVLAHVGELAVVEAGAPHRLRVQPEARAAARGAAAPRCWRTAG